MSAKKLNIDYFDLSQHNAKQTAAFVMIFAICVMLVFYILTPLLNALFHNYLGGVVYNNGEEISYLVDNEKDVRRTGFYTAWAVDVYVGTPQQARYWFNPILSTFMPILAAALALSVVVTSALPGYLGLFRQKIEREIAAALDGICLKINGYHSTDELNQIASDLMASDLRDLHDYERDWGWDLEDLKVLKKALLWREYGALKKLLFLNHGLQVYFRFYFTSKYSNTILGFVYIGAAILIIIIGLRGLKFIPANEPSLVLFALGLEFSLLLIYAFSLMYGKGEQEEQKGAGFAGAGAHTHDLGDAKEVESLLRVFIKSKDKETKQ